MQVCCRRQVLPPHVLPGYPCVTSDPWTTEVADPWEASLAARKLTSPVGIAGSAADDAGAPVSACAGSDAAGGDAWQGYHQSSQYRPRLGDGDGGGGGGPHEAGGGKGSGHRRRWRERFEPINWEGLQLVPEQKDFSFECPTVATRSDEECAGIRTRNSIWVLRACTQGPIPKPITRLEEAPFPDWAATELRRQGFEKPTPLQVQAWPVVLKGHDLVCIAEDANGKTAAYLLPMLVHLLAQPELKPGEGPIGLVLVPDQELCLQVTRQIDAFTASRNIVCRALYGCEGSGALPQDISQQARELASQVDIAVVTPRCLIALLNSRLTNLRRATFIVLDEADELMERGFGAEVRLILSQVRPDRQALLFTATWSTAVESLAEDICDQQPIHINVGSVKLSACKSIFQRLHQVKPKDSKTSLLVMALEQIRPQLCSERLRALIFCNDGSTVRSIVSHLQRHGYACKGLLPEDTQEQRDELIGQFATQESELWLLVCTRLLGLGLKLPSVRYVINYDLPQSALEYLHRIGRAGPGRESPCYALSFFAPGDAGLAWELAMVLRESQQEVPGWLPALGQQHWWAAWGSAAAKHARDRKSRSAYPPGRGAAGAPTDRWEGRGRGRRDVFLAQCRGRGAARKGNPGI